MEGETTLGAVGVEGGGVGGCGCGLAQEGEPTLGATAVEGVGGCGCGCGSVEEGCPTPAVEGGGRSSHHASSAKG